MSNSDTELEEGKFDPPVPPAFTQPPKRNEPACMPVRTFGRWLLPFDDTGEYVEVTPGKVCCYVVTFVLVLVSAILFEESFERVNYYEYGIGYSTLSGELDTEVALSGRHFVGLSRDFHRIPRLLATIDFSASSGSQPMSLRVKNGEQILVDISFQYRIDESDVLPLYKAFQFGYPSNFRKTAESSFRLVAARYAADEFFHNRSLIETDMLATLQQKIEERHATLVGLQVRNIDLPDSFENRLVEIELKKQDALKATEDILLAQITAQTNKQLLELRASKNKLLAELGQETRNQELLILQNRTEIEQETDRQLNALEAELQEFVALFTQETQNAVLQVLHNKTLIEQQTAQEVSEIDAKLEEYLEVFNQETVNQQLAILQNKTVQEQLTLQTVAAVNAQRDEYKQLYEQETKNLVAALQRNTTVVREETEALVKQIGVSQQLVVAEVDAAITLIAAAAASDAQRVVDEVRASSAVAEATMEADALQGLSTDVSFSANDIVHDSWVSAFEATAESRKFMDMETPRELLLSANTTLSS